MILPLFKVVGGAVAHFCSTISAIDHAGKQAAFACLCPAMPLLANLLHLVKDLLLDDRRVGIVENCLLFNGRFPLFLSQIELVEVLKLTVHPVYSRRSRM